MAVEDVPKDKIINERSSYFQVLYYIPTRDLYRWDDRYEYMVAVGYIPVDGQTIPPTLPPGPGSPFNAAETQYLDAQYASDAEVQGAISQAGSALGIATEAKSTADAAQQAAGNAATAAGDAATAASNAGNNAANAASLAGQAQTAANAAAANAAKVGSLALLNKSRMIDSWAADKVNAQAVSRVNYEDAIASVEAWGGLSNWKYTAGQLQVSGGKLYSGGVAGSAAGGVQVVDIGVFTRAVAKTTVTIPASGTDSGDLIIGFSDEIGVTPTAGGARAKGITFQGSTGQIQTWDLARGAQIGTYVPGGTYYVTATVDATTISITVTQPGSTFSFNTWMSRVGFNVKSRYVFNNDQRALNGKSIGTFGLMTSLSSHRTRAGIEDLSPFWAHISDNGTYRLHIALPPNYDSRKPSPVLLCFHGAGTNAANYGSGNNNNTALMSGFTAAGFIVVSASLNANLTTWGADAGLAVYEYAYQYMKSFFAISGIAFHANSMGGIESLLTLARDTVPCSVWIGWNPTAGLKNNYNRGIYTSQIAASYGIASDGSDLAAKTAGHDPVDMDGSAFRGVPMMVIQAMDDVNVYPSENWDLIEAKIGPYAREYQRIPVTGGHSSPDLAGQVPALLAFVQKYIANTLS